MGTHKQGFGNAEIEELTVAIYALTVEIKRLLGIDSGRSVQRKPSCPVKVGHDQALSSGKGRL